MASPVTGDGGNIQVNIEEEVEESECTSSYYDVLLLGRTGQGKSTTANKLLQTEITFSNPNPYTTQWEERVGEDGGAGEATGAVAEAEDPRVIFQTGTGIESVTNNCKLVSNETTNMRVLDTPGFADSRETRRQGVFQGNFQIFRSILRAQDENDLAFSRVLYFLPHRGPLERADGTLQEELQLIHGFLGDEVFKIMVIIATNRYKQGKTETVIDDEDLSQTQKVFLAALEKITGTANSEKKIIEECPPAIYLAFHEPDLYPKILGAYGNLYSKPLKKPGVVEVSPDTRSIEELMQSARQQHRGRKLQFRDRCVKCCAKLIYSESHMGRFPDRVIVNEGGETEKVERHGDSKCHPFLVPKYSTVTKFVGGVFHIAFLGTFALAGKVRGKKFWPGFTNSEEKCLKCDKDLGSEGCLKINEKFVVKTKEGPKEITNVHKTTLDKLHVEAT